MQIKYDLNKKFNYFKKEAHRKDSRQ